jgi:hypothetical protein
MVNLDVRLEVFTEMKIQAMVFLLMTWCSVVVGYKFQRPCCLQVVSLEKSAMGKHSVNLGHCIQFHDTSILTKKARHMVHIVREVTEIELHPNNMNRKEGPL